MKLDDILKQKSTDTGKVSEQVRAINYSLIAICWILANQDFDKLQEVLWPLAIIGCSLLLDILQYFIRGEYLERFFNKQEKNWKKVKNSVKWDDYEAEDYPIGLSRFCYCFYIGKTLLTIFAVILLIMKLIAKV